MTKQLHEALYAEARRAAAHAYAPYSGYRVGAVAVTAAGDHVAGANVENAAYGSTICAEATAIAAAASAGARAIDTIAVAGLDGDDCYPCGNCRQLMVEFGVRSVIVSDGAGGVRAVPFEDLLPHSFGPDDLAAAD